MKPFKIILAIILLISPCQISKASAEDHFRWRQYYQPINEHQARRHLQKALNYVTKILGPASFHVDHVYLYLSQPKNSHDRIKKGFQLTEANDLAAGEFTIYLSHNPTENACLGQLVHEVTHLMDSRIHDAYFEGLSTVMAEKYLKENGLDWSGWRDYFARGHEPFYARTYFMMREIWDVVGDEGMRDFHTYTQASPEDPGQLRIDINRWIQKVPRAHQLRVRGIIAKYAPQIKLAMNQNQHPTAFLMPDIL